MKHVKVYTSTALKDNEFVLISPVAWAEHINSFERNHTLVSRCDVDGEYFRVTFSWVPKRTGTAGDD